MKVILMQLFDLVRYHIPFKMVIGFGFLLYNSKEDSFKSTYINDHLSRDPQNRNVINQVPNVWEMHNRTDEQQVIVDIGSSDFFNQVRDLFAANNYNFMVLRATHMAVQIFPMVNNNIYHDASSSVRGSMYGHGPKPRTRVNVTSDDNDDDDDDCSDYDVLDYTEDDVDYFKESRCNPFIMDEAEVDFYANEFQDESNNDQDDEDQSNSNDTSDEDDYLIRVSQIDRVADNDNEYTRDCYDSSQDPQDQQIITDKDMI